MLGCSSDLRLRDLVSYWPAGCCLDVFFIITLPPTSTLTVFTILEAFSRLLEPVHSLNLIVVACHW